MSILGRDLLIKLAPILGLNMKTIRRVVIDIKHDDVVSVYTESAGDTRLIEFDWPGELKDADVRLIR